MGLEIKIAMRLNESLKNWKIDGRWNQCAQGWHGVCLGEAFGVRRQTISSALHRTLLLLPLCSKHPKEMML